MLLSRLARCVCSLGLLGLAATPVQAQGDADSQFWTMLTLNKTFPNRIRLYGEIQPRLGTDYSRTSLLLIRGSIGYQFTPQFSASVGYGWTPSFTPEFNNEDRWYGQLLWENRVGTYRMVNRTRLEIRSIAGVGEESYRLRHQTRLSKPIKTGSKWIGIFANELFWNLNSAPRGPEGGFDQYRAFFGAGYQVTRAVRAELGYQATWLNLPRNPVDRRQDILLLTLNVDL
jgi:hypothetical protein